ncbi:MAG: histidine phosphatase family protein [Acidobacteriia bacterium]|nr:histidine phosphatase family protein [Terriglobia bacterium]
MSTLTLVRHGQAEPFQGERSVLTSLGETQAARLAQFWLRQQVRFDEVYSGDLPRQTRTEQVVADCFRASGQPWPEPQADAAWNEYDAPGMLQHLASADPSRAATVREIIARQRARQAEPPVPLDPDPAATGSEQILATLAAQYAQARSGPNANRAFQRMFEALMLRWLEGGTADGVEPWTTFRDRVSGAIRRIMEGPPGRRVAVFTSGGPIGFAVHFALRAPVRSFLDVNWRVRNSSVTEFIFDRERFTLDSFNGIPHLIEDAALRTWR